jgi:hypothetical protein
MDFIFSPKKIFVNAIKLYSAKGDFQKAHITKSHNKYSSSNAMCGDNKK